MRLIASMRSLCFALMMLVLSAASFAQISISVAFAPPALPVYEQPLVPGDGYLWIPGYWAYADDDYYFGPQATGAGATTDMSSMMATGVRPWASTGGSVTATDILGRAMREDVGRTDSFTTTAR